MKIGVILALMRRTIHLHAIARVDEVIVFTLTT